MIKVTTEQTLAGYRTKFEESGSKWEWSEKWDGHIEELCFKLDDAGFSVTHIWNKGQVQCYPRDHKDKLTIWKALYDLANDISEIHFSPSKITIQFSMGSPVKRALKNAVKAD